MTSSLFLFSEPILIALERSKDHARWDRFSLWQKKACFHGNPIAWKPMPWSFAHVSLYASLMNADGGFWFDMLQSLRLKMRDCRAIQEETMQPTEIAFPSSASLQKMRHSNLLLSLSAIFRWNQRGSVQSGEYEFVWSGLFISFPPRIEHTMVFTVHGMHHHSTNTERASLEMPFLFHIFNI